MGTPGLAAGRVRRWVEAMRVELRLLGPVEAVSDGRSLPLRGTKQRTVLAVLALQAGRAVPVRRLMDTVWGHDPPRTAHQQVLNAVSQLRHLLGAAVVTRPSGYLLNPELASVDLSLFQAECAEAREAALDGRPADAARLLRAGLARW